ncbi:hypothetical protein GXW82_31165 [Streptacidiphilus sp. 4-A2]|nr:hypothetical protein [Streptacidiphilus sp. 4-A2]
MKSVRSSRAASALPGSAHITWSSGRSRSVNWSAISSRAARKTGWISWTSRPMPGSWLP